MSPLDTLAALDAATFGTGLSPQNARAGWAAALAGARQVPLDRVLDGEPPRCVTIVASANVFTAPLEWAWGLSARGVRVILKSARGLAPVGEAIAAALPGVEHRVWRGGELEAEAAALAESNAAIVFGSAETIAAIRARSPAPVLGFGPRFGVAVLGQLGPAEAAGVALDHALYDGRGCMSPAGVFVSGGVDLAAVGDAMAAAQVALPVGEVSAVEAGGLRALELLARVEGGVVKGEGWLAVELPIGRFVPRGLPRAVVIHRGDVSDVSAALAPWRGELGTVAGDVTGLGRVERVCEVGAMQLPRGDRERHDGVDVWGVLWGGGR